MRSVFAAAFVLLAALPARADDLRIPLDEDFANFEVMWNKNEHSSTVYWNVVDYNGRLAVCGLIQHHDASLMQFDHKMLRRSTMKINGKVALKGMEYFTAIGAGGKPEKSQATCKVLDGPLPPRDSQFEFNTPRMREYS